jgi:hypothetical protein
MPSFPHTLIGLGPFANQGCKIVFNKTLVTVYHPDSHPILSGFRDTNGPQLWQFPLTMPPSLPAHAPPSDPLAGGLSAAMAAGQPHPSQGFWATITTGEDIQVKFLRGETQSMAKAAHASSTPYNLQTLNLSSISALVSFYHACLDFPVKQTWLDAIKAGNCDTFDGLTYSNVARYCPNSNETILGHLAQQRQNIRWYGAHVCGTKTYIFNPSLRLVLYHFLHSVSLCHHETIHYTQQTATNTATMVAEPLAPPATRI